MRWQAACRKMRSTSIKMRLSVDGPCSSPWLKTPSRLPQRARRWNKPGQRVWMQRVRNGGLARVMQKPKLITLQVEISPRMRTCIDAALKLLSAPRWLASHTQRLYHMCERAMPTYRVQKPTVAAMNAGGRTCKDGWTNLRPKRRYYC